MASSGIAAGFWQSFPGRLVTKYSDTQAGTWAQVIAYNALFSMFPIFLAILTLVGFFLRGTGISDQITSGVASVLPGDAGQSVVDALQGTERNAGTLAIVSLVGLLWSGSALFGAIEQAFNVAYGVPARSFVRAKLMAIVMIFVFTVLVILTIVTSSAATFLVGLSTNALPFPLPGGKLLITVVGYLLSIVSAFVLFYAVLWVAPNRRFRFGEVWPGALVAAVLFVIVTQSFPIYAQQIANFNRYGATFGLSFLLMTWFYLLGQILMFGVLINAVHCPATAAPSTATQPSSPKPVAAPPHCATVAAATLRRWVVAPVVVAGIVLSFFVSLMGKRARHA